MRKPIEKESNSLIEKVIEQSDRGKDHYFRGHLFSAIGDFYSSKYLNDMLDFQKGGKLKAKLPTYILLGDGILTDISMTELVEEKS